jgi:hypothetical protein
MITPFFFIKGGMNVSLTELSSNLWLFGLLFALKTVTKFVGVLTLAIYYFVEKPAQENSPIIAENAARDPEAVSSARIEPEPQSYKTWPSPAPRRQEAEVLKRNHLHLGDEALTHKSYYISVVEPFELDFKRKDQIYSLRESYVKRHRTLAGDYYEPSAAVFGQIVGGKPWWGLYGLYFYGAGQHSIDGPSEESRILANPFPLVAIIESKAFTNDNQPQRFHNYYPRPRQIVYRPAQAAADVLVMLKMD